MEQSLEPENVQENARIKVLRFNTSPATGVAALVGYVAIADGEVEYTTNNSGCEMFYICISYVILMCNYN